MPNKWVTFPHTNPTLDPDFLEMKLVQLQNPFQSPVILSGVEADPVEGLFIHSA